MNFATYLTVYIGRIKLVTVQVLGEPPLISPLATTELLALKSKRKWNLEVFDDLRQCRSFRRLLLFIVMFNSYKLVCLCRVHSSQFPWPDWVYNLNELSYYTKVLLEGLSSYGKGSVYVS